jgi:hypothetical protein
MSEAIKNPPLSQTEIKNAADELYNQLVVETEGQIGEPAKKVLAEVREKYAKF